MTSFLSCTPSEAAFATVSFSFTSFISFGPRWRSQIHGATFQQFLFQSTIRTKAKWSAVTHSRPIHSASKNALEIADFPADLLKNSRPLASLKLPFFKGNSHCALRGFFVADLISKNLRPHRGHCNCNKFAARQSIGEREDFSDAKTLVFTGTEEF